MPDVLQEAVDAAFQHVRSQPVLWQYVREQDVRAILEAAAPYIAEDAKELRQRAEHAEAGDERVRNLHSEIPYKPGSCYCANAYPCPTIRALDGEEVPRG